MFVMPLANGALASVANEHVNTGVTNHEAGILGLAEFNYRQAIRIDPCNALAHFNLAHILDRRGDTALALDHYRVAVRYTYADAMYYAAICARNLGMKYMAFEYFDLYCRVGENEDLVNSAHDELTRLQDKLL